MRVKEGEARAKSGADPSFFFPLSVQKMGLPASFDTLQREKRFRQPSSAGPDHATFNELVAPHIESFNALFEDSGLPVGDGEGAGLLAAGLKEIGEKYMFDRVGAVGSGEGKGGWGNRLVGACPVAVSGRRSPIPVRVESVSIGKPMVSERAKGLDVSGNTRIYPAEVRATRDNVHLLKRRRLANDYPPTAVA